MYTINSVTSTLLHIRQGEMALKQALNDAVAEALKDASIYTTKQTIQLRVLREAFEHFFQDLNTIYDLKHLQYIPIPVANCIETIWKSYMMEYNTHEEIQFIEKILAKDYHKHSDLVKLANLFSKKVVDPNGRKLLNTLFAVDGLDGNDYKNYVHHLGNMDAYCTGVRRLYTQTTEEDVLQTIRQTIDGNDMTGLFKSCIGEEQFESVMKEKRKQMEKKKDKKRKSEDVEEDGKKMKNTGD